MGWVSFLEDIQKIKDNSGRLVKCMQTDLNNEKAVKVSVNSNLYHKIVENEVKEYLFNYDNKERSEIRTASKLLLELKTNLWYLSGFDMKIFCLSEELPIWEGLEYCLIFRQCMAKKSTKEAFKDPFKLREMFLKMLGQTMKGCILEDKTKTGITKIKVKEGLVINTLILKEDHNKNYHLLRFREHDRKWYWEENQNSRDCFTRLSIIEKNKTKELANILLAFKKMNYAKLNETNYFSSLLSALDFFYIEPQSRHSINN